MKLDASTIASIILAIALHAGVIVLLVLNWEPDVQAQVVKEETYSIIRASVVKENPYTAKKEREEQKAKARRIKQQAELIASLDAKREAEKQAAINRQKIKQAELKALAEKKTEAPEPPSLPDTNTAAEEAALEAARLKQASDLQLAINEEAKGQLAVTDDEQAMAYVAQIKKDIIQNWSRPPSARNGMQAVLKVFLVPTGEVVNVTVEQSSGNDAFDRSAVLAVRKAGRFIVPTVSRQFEKNFRTFEVLFRPEDLRL